MKRLLLLVLICSTIFAASAADAKAGAAENSLGMMLGVNMPFKGGRDYHQVSEAYGFYVDLLVYKTFFITPEAIIYRLNAEGDGDGSYGRGITDIDIAFKFIIPLGSFNLMFAMKGGISNGVQSSGIFKEDWPLTVNFGAKTGLDWNFVSNLALTTQAVWSFMPLDEGNLQQLFIFAGLRYTF